jgi:hypothetical protein
MAWLDEAARALGAAVLPVVTVLLLEELTYGGLVRLLIAPWPRTKTHSERKHRSGNGERKCSH